jgi:RimJ/RimL family protein N-acetyltransferase
LATEFSAGALRYGFETIALTEISAVVRPNHLASIKVLEKAGLSYVRDIHDVMDAPPSLLYSLMKALFNAVMFSLPPSALTTAFASAA